jgi:hypothetical protein
MYKVNLQGNVFGCSLCLKGGGLIYPTCNLPLPCGRLFAHPRVSTIAVEIAWEAISKEKDPTKEKYLWAAIQVNRKPEVASHTNKDLFK